MRRAVWLAGLVTSMVLAACGSGSGGSGGGTGGRSDGAGGGGGERALACVPDSIRTCTGSGECQGTQRCRSDGSSWDVCQCVETGTGGSAAGGDGGASAIGGTSSGGSSGTAAVGGAPASGGTGGDGTGGTTVDPACAAADSDGFFSDCTACLDVTDCDTINGRRACGCSSVGCPCGFSCGSYEIAPGVSVSGICVR